MKYDLISIGSITKDIFVLTERGKIFKTPKDKLALAWLGFELGEKISVQEVVESAGGVATNLSLGTKKLGLNSFPVGPVKPATSVIIVDKRTGERVIFYQKSSGAVNLKPLREKKAKYISVSSLTGNWNGQANEIMAYIKKNKAKLIVAPSTSMIREGYISLKKLFSQSEIIFLNKNEATEIAFNEKNKTSNVGSLIKILHKLGPKIVCLTDGRKGAYCSDGRKIFHCPIQKVKTVDVTGAGDAFASGFLGKYIKGGSIQESLRMGIRNSANVVRYVGTIRGLLKK
ncbi:MAG: carbohydrate kinase family protein [Candidatus Moranbacteria bacterium]|nr:carbohydrate kinase family protein [Candidatus Moranbacteria bacterium]